MNVFKRVYYTFKKQVPDSDVVYCNDDSFCHMYSALLKKHFIKCNQDIFPIMRAGELMEVDVDSYALRNVVYKEGMM